MRYTITRHAEARMQQRGLRKRDLELMLVAADQVGPDAYLMTNEVVDGEISRLKKEIQQFERLRGKKLIVEGDIVVTAYDPCQRNQAKTLRKGRAHA